MKRKKSPVKFGDTSKNKSKTWRRKMNLHGPEPVQVEVSLEHIKEAMKEYLYRRGYAKGANECIADVSFGALHETNIIPIQFWVEKEQEDIFTVLK